MASIERIMQGAVGAALSRAASATGTDFAHLLATAKRESGFNASAKASTSSAAGMFQFIEGTWLEMMRRHGAKHGQADAAAAIDLVGGRARVADPALRKQILDLRFDPELSARMAGELTRENQEILQNKLGRAATPSELYAAHVLGPHGAGRLIAAAEADAPSAAALFPREAAANKHLFFARDGRARSAAELMDRLALSTVAPAEILRNDPPPGPAPLTSPALSAPQTPAAALIAAMIGPMALELLEDPEPRAAELSLLATDAYARAARVREP